MTKFSNLAFNLDNPYAIPSFETLSAADFETQINQAFERLKEKVEQLEQQAGAPSFEKDVVVLDTIYDEYNDISQLYHLYYESVGRKDIKKIYETISKIDHKAGILVCQNEVIASRLEAIFTQRHSLNLDQEDLFFLERQYALFEREGAFLTPEDKAKINKIDEELIEVTTKFKEKLSDSFVANTVTITNEDELAGLPPEEKEKYAIKSEADLTPKWKFVPDRFSVPALASIAEDRNFRKKLFDALENVGKDKENNTEECILQILKLRHERAKVMGYETYADLSLKSTMVQTQDGVRNFLNTCIEKTIHAYAEDREKLQAFVIENDGPEELQPYDMPYWVAKYQKANFDFSSQELVPYLDCAQQIDGLINHISKLFDLKFNERQDLPRFHEDVRVFEVLNNSDQGACIGLVYIDLFKRPETKRDGAWMQMVRRSGDGQPPIMTLNANYAGSGDGKGILLTIEDVETLYHEAGHGLHNLLGQGTKYQSCAGSAGSPDFIELHSQIQEIWINDPEIAPLSMKHHETGEAPSQEMMARWSNSKKFFGAAMMLRTAQNSWLDLMVHTTSPDKMISIQKLMDEAERNNPYAEEIGRYPLSWFSHLFSYPTSQYASGYYGYLYSSALDADAFVPFKGDPYNTVAKEKLKELYKAGASLPYAQLYRNYRGADLSLEPMLKRVGIEVQNEGSVRPVKEFTYE